MAGPVVALVLVSHSSLLAQGLAEVAAQMAPDVPILPAGGTADGRVGTGFDLIEEAITRALEGGRSAVVLTDLGSATLTTESVLEMAEPDVAARVRVVDAPFVEGAIEAAVVAQTGADLRTVVEAAEDAATTFTRSAHAGADDAVGPAAPSTGGPTAPAAGEPAPVAASAFEVDTHPANELDRAGASGADAGPVRAPEAPHPHHSGTPTARGTAVLRNRLGLHARPAAQLARTVGVFDALVTVNGVDARSVLALVGLGAVGGQEVVVAATGPHARTAVNAVIDELENGFGEA